MQYMQSTWLLIAALAGASGVALGAFGAHGLKARVAPEMLAVFETGVRYHLVHALALLGVAALAGRTQPVPGLSLAGTLFVVGIVVFSGSLYVMTLTGARWLGAITPLGGLALIAGWLVLAVAAWRIGG